VEKITTFTKKVLLIFSLGKGGRTLVVTPGRKEQKRVEEGKEEKEERREKKKKE